VAQKLANEIQIVWQCTLLINKTDMQQNRLNRCTATENHWGKTKTLEHPQSSPPIAELNID